MSEVKMRAVDLWDGEVEWETRADGSVLVRQTGDLGAYPDKMSERIEHWAHEAPDRVWMAERGPGGGDWVTVSYGEMLGYIRAIGQELLDLGLSTERPLLILSGNSIAHALMALGAQYVGVPSAALAPAYSLMSEDFEKLRAIKAQITPGAVFAENLDQFAGAMGAVFSELPHIGVVGHGAEESWEELLATKVTEAVDQANAAITPDTVAKFMFTSGTTGNPKAVVQTQRMLCANMAQVADCFRYFRDEPPVLLDWAPWNHVASGNKVFNMALYNGGSFYIDGGKP
ncbi:MAG: AMP-binding protein, partial [Maritimibacter sp.]